MANSRDFTGKNRKFTGTKGIVPPKGSTGERVGAESGEFRFNTTTELMEYYDGAQWKAIDAPPSISNITTSDSVGTSTVLNADGSTLFTITINGSNFGIGATVKFIGNTGTIYNAGNVTRVSGSQITCTTILTMGTTDDPYSVTVTNGSGLSATLADAFTFNAPPVFTVASGQLGTVYNGQTISGTTLNAGATDAEGNTITFTIISGSLPGSGLSFSSSTGAITGTLSGSPSLGNYPFVVRASTTEGVRERQFSIQVVVNPYIVATGGTTYDTGGYRYHKFTSSVSGASGFAVTSAGASPFNTVDYLIVAGGGAGGHRHAGGGGAGGLIQSNAIPTVQQYAVVVGAGGAKFTNADQSGRIGRNGDASSILGITATGGGGGGDNGPAGTSGGSGGGGGESGSPAGSGTGGQGNPGGSGNGGYGGGGGGGGKGATGTAGSSGGQGGAGGDYTTFASATSSGVSNYYAGGGGGGGYACGGRAAAGGAGGGGIGGGDDRSGTDATAFSGGGGGGGGQTNGPIAGSGGSGIVIVRYPIP